MSDKNGDQSVLEKALNLRSTFGIGENDSVDQQSSEINGLDLSESENDTLEIEEAEPEEEAPEAIAPSAVEDESQESDLLDLTDLTLPESIAPESLDTERDMNRDEAVQAIEDENVDAIEEASPLDAQSEVENMTEALPDAIPGPEDASPTPPDTEAEEDLSSSDSVTDSNLDLDLEQEDTTDDVESSEPDQILDIIGEV